MLPDRFAVGGIISRKDFEGIHQRNGRPGGFLVTRVLRGAVNRLLQRGHIAEVDVAVEIGVEGFAAEVEASGRAGL